MDRSKYIKHIIMSDYDTTGPNIILAKQKLKLLHSEVQIVIFLVYTIASEPHKLRTRHNGNRMILLPENSLSISVSSHQASLHI
jgi:hypothetical protein